jgi:hypothetical protein
MVPNKYHYMDYKYIFTINLIEINVDIFPTNLIKLRKVWLIRKLDLYSFLEQERKQCMDYLIFITTQAYHWFI